MSTPLLPVEAGWKVGLFGGSFDPPHDGHAHVARMAMERLGLDRVVWLVSPGNPLKAGAHGSFERRFEAVSALAGEDRMIVSDIERRLGTHYTIDLVRALQAGQPGVDFVWVMGSDNLEGFHHWGGWQEIAERLPIAVVARPGSEDADTTSAFANRYSDQRLAEADAARLPGHAAPAWVFLRGELHPASSTAIREGRGS